jgi:D-serine deaminase-like pyridoxal phosphate-dependent protein
MKNGGKMNKCLELIETPALIIDAAKMKENIREYHEVAASFGVHVRPHVKTHKIPSIAKLQIEMGARGIVTAKVSEAEVMANAGIDDIFIAYPIVGRSKLERLAKLNHRLKRLIVSVESIEAGKQLSDMGIEKNKKFKVLVDVDTGAVKRTGFDYAEAYEKALELSRMPGIEIIGVYSYSYLTYKGVVQDSPELAGHMEGKSIVALAKKLSKAGLNMEIVAGGSTPTGKYVASVPGITEIQPGEYPFYDIKLGKYGISSEKCAAFILTTVVSSSNERIVIDGGSKTFSTDISITKPPNNLTSYGVVVGYEDELVFHRMSEEHGIIISNTGKPLNIPIGTRLQIIPNHICTSIALHSFAYLVGNDNFEKVPVAARGMLY